jgi:formate/nitrite transporter
MKMFGFEAYSPRKLAEQVEAVGVAKARLPLLSMFMLGICAGGFIGLGALYYTLVAADPALSFAVSRMLGGVAFSLGLILVVVAGAELFTGNNLMMMGWVDGRITTGELMRNWLVVFLANAVGAAGLVIIVWLSHHGDMSNGAVAEQYVKIASAKMALPFWEAFYKGVLCNLLVCLAVWMAIAGSSVTDRVLAVVFPISAFVAAGFEHSIANMYLIPLGILYGSGTPAAAGLAWSGLVGNLVPVTLGNIVGGSIMVAAVYAVIYRHETDRSP